MQKKMDLTNPINSHQNKPPFAILDQWTMDKSNSLVGTPWPSPQGTPKGDLSHKD